MSFKLLQSYEPKEKLVLWISLFLHVCCAWFSVGYHYDDEHWQILEFANYKLGLSPVGDLPWEFTDQIRPTLQPLIVYAIAKVMMALKAYNPFTLIFLLRLVTGILSWVATLLIIQHTRQFFTKRIHFYYLILFASFLWFIPYIHVRYSGETWSGLFFFFGLYYLLEILENEKEFSKNWVFKSFLVGLSLGISFWCRFQIMFALVGLGAWILVFKFKSILKLVPTIFGALLILGIGVLVDHWFYNKWVFTPYNYFESNIIKNVAASFGETPWWDYIKMFILHAGIPISILLLGAIILSVYAQPKNPYVWAFFAFIGGHMLVGHKEMRFLFPLIYILPIICFLPVTSKNFNKWLVQIPKGVYRIGGLLLVGMNCILLTVIVFIKAPADNVLLYQYLYSHTNGKPVKLVTLSSNPCIPGHLKVNFYLPPDFEIIKIDSASQLKSFANKSAWTVYFFDDHFTPDQNALKVSNLNLVYRNYPTFIRKFNFNGWVDRQKIYSLYVIK